MVYIFLFWLPDYVSSTSGVSAADSGYVANFFEYGGILGGVIAGVMSDQSGMSATTCAVMLVLAVPVMFFYQVPQELERFRTW